MWKGFPDSRIRVNLIWGEEAIPFDIQVSES